MRAATLAMLAIPIVIASSAGSVRAADDPSVIASPVAAPPVAAPATALPRIWALGPARAISHSSSASRDTFLLVMQVVPRRLLTAGGDAGIVGVRAAGMSWRLGFQGMLELESEGLVQGFTGTPQGDVNFWRGVYGYSLAWSLDRLAARWLGEGGALEATLSGRHESEHRTASNEGGASPDYGDRPHVGNFVMLDLAARLRLGVVDLVARLQHQLFFPGSGYTHGPGADLHARWRALGWLHPFVSLFGEYRWGAVDTRPVAAGARYPDAWLARLLLGVMIPSPAGDIHVYLAGDIGHRKGLAVFTREATLGAGVRLAFW